ncbi:unnamed protein product [Hymenolepis diminuta]|uniref:RING-type domain-containing protein n=1 Tax=Hymenolepis diminuta TaxID=6216 RepID=A0A0R3SQ25_HYMDI|nr:unnamed protein product [Hymenolepis diminuta]VUZ54304.1 unnamed protein product [Hymenolepis diminuta]
MGNCLRRFRSRRHTSENDRRSNGHTSSNQSQSRHVENDPILHPAPGLSVPYSQLTEEQQVTIATRMALIATLPILHFDEVGDEKIPECVICMIGYVPGDELRKMPMCIHIFHRACIDDWLTRSLTCPSCLQEIPIPSNVPPATIATTTDSETGDTSTNEQRLQSVSPPSIASIREEVLRIKMRSRQQQMSQSIREEESQMPQEPPQGPSSTVHPPDDVD